MVVWHIDTENVPSLTGSVGLTQAHSNNPTLMHTLFKVQLTQVC